MEGMGILTRPVVKIERGKQKRKGKREREKRERGPTVLGHPRKRQRRSCGGIGDNEVEPGQLG